MEVESRRCLFSSSLLVAADAKSETSFFVLFGCFEGWLRLIADGSQPLFLPKVTFICEVVAWSLFFVFSLTFFHTEVSVKILQWDSSSASQTSEDGEGGVRNQEALTACVGA